MEERPPVTQSRSGVEVVEMSTGTKPPKPPKPKPKVALRKSTPTKPKPPPPGNKESPFLSDRGKKGDREANIYNVLSVPSDEDTAME
jgi:hypothetical protein